MSKVRSVSKEPGTVLPEQRIRKLIAFAKETTKPWLCVDVVNALEELLRHRRLEHDAYWGDDDD